MKFDDSDSKVVFVRALKTNGLSPFLTFRNTHASHMCFNEVSPSFTVSNGTTYTVPGRSNPGDALTDGLGIPHPTTRDNDRNYINPEMDVSFNFSTSRFSSLLVYSIVVGNIESTIMVYIVVQDKIEQQNLFSQRSYETNIPECQDPGWDCG